MEENKKKEEQNPDEGFWSYITAPFESFRHWQEKQSIERSRESNGRIRGTLKATEARYISWYGRSTKTLDEAIEIEVCKIEDVINFVAEKNTNTHLSVNIENLSQNIKEGIVKHYKESGYNVYFQEFNGVQNLVIDWSNVVKIETKQSEEVKEQ